MQALTKLISNFLSKTCFSNLTTSFLSSHAPIAIIPAYMVNEEGRKAVDAMNIPLLGARNKSIIRDTFDPHILFTVLKYTTKNNHKVLHAASLN